MRQPASFADIGSASEISRTSGTRSLSTRRRAFPSTSGPLALVTAGVEMDVFDMEYDAFTAEQREEVCACHPRGHGFKIGIIDAFARGTIQKSETTFGNVKADVLELRDPKYKRVNFCEVILNSKLNEWSLCRTGGPAVRRGAASRGIARFGEFATA